MNWFEIRFFTWWKACNRNKGVMSELWISLSISGPNVNWMPISKWWLFAPIWNRFVEYGWFYRQHSSHSMVYFGRLKSILISYSLHHHHCSGWNTFPVHFIFIISRKYIFLKLWHTFIILSLPDAIYLECSGSNSTWIKYHVSALTKFARIEFAYHIHTFNFSCIVHISEVNQKHIEHMETVSYQLKISRDLNFCYANNIQWHWKTRTKCYPFPKNLFGNALIRLDISIACCHQVKPKHITRQYSENGTESWIYIKQLRHSSRVMAAKHMKICRNTCLHKLSGKSIK